MLCKILVNDFYLAYNETCSESLQNAILDSVLKHLKFYGIICSEIDTRKLYQKLIYYNFFYKSK